MSTSPVITFFAKHCNMCAKKNKMRYNERIAPIMIIAFDLWLKVFIIFHMKFLNYAVQYNNKNNNLYQIFVKKTMTLEVPKLFSTKIKIIIK